MKRRLAAFTLVELMIATAVLGVILVFVFGTMVTTQKKAAAVDDTVDVQQAARQIADLIERDLRHTGMMVPDAAAICGVDNDDAPDRFYVTDPSVIQPGKDLRPLLGSTVTGATTLPASGSLFTVDTLVLEEATPDPTFDIDGDGTLDSDFAPTGYIILADANNPGRGSACGAITDVQLPNQIQYNLDLGGLDPVGPGSELPRIVAVPAIRYSIDAQGRLFRGAYQLASNVEDMQLAWFFDNNENNTIDLGEYRGDGIGADYVAQGMNASLLREIRLNVVLRTESADPEITTGNPIATENRTVTPTNDGFRRRVYTGVVRLRNLGRRIQL
jgi:prepilin-type N-terminal cleavage/methylation domain-containing protein